VGDSLILNHHVCDERFASVREAFTANFDDGEIGASCTVVVDGATVVDLWGGWADDARTRPWQADTLCDAYSVGKPKAYHLAPQQLPFQVKRGDQIVMSYELDPDAPVGEKEIARPGGWWWLTAVSRGDRTVFEICGTDKAHQVEVNSVLRPLQVISRK